jgi:hypothetical protein
VALPLSDVPQLAKEDERTPLFRLIFGESAYRHQAAYANASELPELIKQGRQPFRRHSTLLRLGGAVDLDQNVLHCSGTTPVELTCQVSPVHGMDEPETADGAPSLVALETADEVPLDLHSSGAFLFLQRLLDAIFSDVVEPRCHSGSHSFWAVRLGHPNDPHLVAPAPGCLAAGYCVAHEGQPFRQAWEIHNPLIYWRIVGY